MNTLRPKLTLLDEHPTPLQYLSGLSQELFRELYIKRDDVTPFGGGGGMLRKLEYLLFDAVNSQSDTVVTVGDIRSDHCRLTAAAAAKYGLRSIVISVGHYDGELSGNLLLSSLFGARTVVKKDDGRPEAVQLEETAKAVMEQKIAQGHRLYFIPMGGSDATGMLGYYDCAAELDKQAQEQYLQGATVYVPVTTLGTYVGLYCGLKAIGSSLKPVGIAVKPLDEDRLGDYFRQVKEAYGFDFDDSDMHIETAYIRKGYGEPDRHVRDAVRLMASHEGILLDPTSSGKAFAAVLDMIKEKKIKLGRQVIFLHDGSMAGLYEKAHCLKLEKELQDTIQIIP